MQEVLIKPLNSEEVSKIGGFQIMCDDKGVKFCELNEFEITVCGNGSCL